MSHGQGAAEKLFKYLAPKLPVLKLTLEQHENKTCSACRERVNERLKECESVRVRECESERVRECESERVTFEPRHENKSCSACRERVNESE